ncbi:MAG: NUDIX domain-containing protein [Bacteroidetes bacterium]|nr:MAG: NUDIX domain-containing protein [Bacteroidota bacterium]
MQWIVRVYGLMQDEAGRYLVMEEYFRGGWIVKFPGGGVQPQEGLIEALARELAEELSIQLTRAEHFYTTEFFQRSYYHAAARLLAVYYRVGWVGEIRPQGPYLRLYWLPAAFIPATFPVDRHVVQLLTKEEK